jgi:transposase
MYTEAFKDAMVVKMTVPGGVSASVLSKETGVSQPTLSKWKKSRARVDGMSNTKNKKRPQDWSAEEKLKAIEAKAKLSEEELGLYLRREGLHFSHLEQWRAELVESLKRDRKNPKRFVSEDKKKIKELEREVRRKDKALAEATALLILKKKAALIWGEVEEDEST